MKKIISYKKQALFALIPFLGIAIVMFIEYYHFYKLKGKSVLYAWGTTLLSLLPFIVLFIGFASLNAMWLQKVLSLQALTGVSVGICLAICWFGAYALIFIERAILNKLEKTEQNVLLK